MSGTNEPADAGASAAPATPSSASSNGGGSAKKRLLPMELRRRRRAAKLQITSEKNIATMSARDVIESINDNNTPDDAAVRDANRNNDDADSNPVIEAVAVDPPQPASLTESDALKDGESDQQHERTSSRETSASKTTSAAKRLENLFSFSLLDRKRQKLQHRESIVDVPTYMKVDQVPLDVTLKSKVVLAMSFPFPFIRPRAASMAAAMTHQQSKVPEVQWLQALQYYVHPASSLPSSLNATNERQLEESEFYVNRFRVWQDSFRHAYFSFRRLSRNGTLYVRYPEFVACFFIDDRKAGADQNDSSIMGLCQSFGSNREQEETEKTSQQVKRLRAVVSQSNARLRKELHRRGVEFTVPFNLRALQNPVTSLQLDDTNLTRHASVSAGTDQSVHGPDSLLHFSGHHAVHGLYEFLLNRKPHSNQDVPEIVASHPFTNASIRSIGVRYMGKTVGRGVGGDASENAISIRSEIELSGFCLPSAIQKLISCLEDSQTEAPQCGVAIKAALETAPMCERLNAVFLDDKGLTTLGASRNGKEREAWKQLLDFAKRRLQSVKKSGGSALEIDMAAR